jgi:hypothetical protein
MKVKPGVEIWTDPGVEADRAVWNISIGSLDAIDLGMSESKIPMSVLILIHNSTCLQIDHGSCCNT